MLYNYYIFSVKHFYHELLVYVQPLPVQRLKNNVTLILLYNITIITIIPIFYFNKCVKYIHVPFFYFQTVQPTNKRYLLAIDVSGSMSWGNCNGTTITPRVASAAMAMLTARTEPQYHFVGFSHRLVPLNINSTMRMDTVLRTIEQVSTVVIILCLEFTLGSYQDVVT